MTTPSHTPGPWFCADWLIGDAKRPQLTIASSTDQVAIVPSLYVNRAKEWAANARLIVAAPDMLAALLAAQATVETHTVRAYKYGCVDRDAEATLAEISAAIARATGTPV